MTACWCACCTAAQTARNSASRARNGPRAGAAVVGQREPLDVLHGEPGRAVGQRAGIVEPGDGGMVEPGQRALLAGEALAPRGRQPGVAEDLDGGRAAQVGALGLVDDPHAALAEQAQHAVGAEHPAAGVAVRVAEQSAATAGISRSSSALRAARLGLRVGQQRPALAASAGSSPARADGVAPGGVTGSAAASWKIAWMRSQRAGRAVPHRGLSPARGGPAPARRARAPVAQHRGLGHAEPLGGLAHVEPAEEAVSTISAWRGSMRASSPARRPAPARRPPSRARSWPPRRR